MNVLCVSKRETREVNVFLKVGDRVEFDHLIGGNREKPVIKISRISITPNDIVISATSASNDYIINLSKNHVIRVGENYYSGAFHGTVSVGENPIAYNSHVGKFEYKTIQKNVEAYLPVIGGDTLRKDGNDYQVLAVAGDGKVFVQREIRYGGFKSQVIDPKDESGYTAFGLVSKLKSEIK